MGIGPYNCFVTEGSLSTLAGSSPPDCCISIFESVHHYKEKASPIGLAFSLELVT